MDDKSQRLGPLPSPIRQTDWFLVHHPPLLCGGPVCTGECACAVCVRALACVCVRA
eukprot:COSAG05_NODE_15147_length_377_cov_0.809353_1_plen_55_part_10